MPYVKNGHTLPIGGGGIGGGLEQIHSPTESEFRVNPVWLPQPDDRRGRTPSDGDHRGALGPRVSTQDENREARRSGWSSGTEDWKSNMAWHGDDGRRGGRLHPDLDKRPGLMKAPSEDGRRTRPESDWKPTLPRHSSVEDGRGRRGMKSQLSIYGSGRTWQMRITKHFGSQFFSHVFFSIFPPPSLLLGQMESVCLCSHGSCSS